MELENIKFRILFLLTITLTYLLAQRIHEIGHWLILQVYHRNPIFGFTGLVQLWGTQPINPNKWTQYIDPITGERGWLKIGSLPETPTEWAVMLASGQIAQIAVLYLSLLLIYSSKNLTTRQLAFLTAIINSLGQIVYHIKSLTMGSFGDEYYLAYYIQTQKWMIHITLLIIYAAGFAIAITKLKADRKTTLKILLTTFVAMILTGLPLMIADYVVRNQINYENPYFQQIMGFSAPVIIVDTLALIVLSITLRKLGKTEIKSF